MLRAYLHSAIGDANTVDDLFQETMLVAWRRLDEFDRERSFGPWLRGIASRLVLAYYRKKSNRELTLDQSAIDWLEARFSEIQKQSGDSFNEKLTALRECVDSLPQTYRDPMRMRYQQGQSLGEIGEKLSIALETLKKRLTRAKQKVADCLDRKIISTEPLS